MLFILVDLVCSNHLGIVEGDVSLLCHDISSLNHQFGTYVYIFQTIFSRLKSLNNHTSTLPETNSKFPLKEAGSQKGKSSKPTSIFQGLLLLVSRSQEVILDVLG